MQLDDALLLAQVRRACKDGTARRLRRRGNLMQEEIGRACGVSGAAVSRWESGERVPTGRPALAYGRLLSRLASSEYLFDAAMGDPDVA